MAQSFNHNFDDFIKAYQKLKAKLPAQFGELSVSFANDNFRAEGFVDNGTRKWQKRAIEGKRKGRGILIDSGRLKRSIRVVSTSPQSVSMGTDIQYAKAHNEGLYTNVSVPSHQRRTRSGRIVTVKSHSRQAKMPKRQFIGESIELQRRITRHVRRSLLRIMKNR